MTAARRFPILTSGLPRGAACPRSVPWALVATHEARARANHGQRLERLAERGGLSPAELYVVVHGVPWHAAPAVEVVLAWLNAIEAA